MSSTRFREGRQATHAVDEVVEQRLKTEWLTGSRNYPSYISTSEGHVNERSKIMATLTVGS